MARKMALNKLNGIPNKAAQKRARKAVHTRIINLFVSGEFDKANKMLDNLREKSSGRYGYVMRRIREQCG